MPIMFIAAVEAMARIGAAMDADAGAAGPGWASGRRGLWPAALAGARRYGAAMMVAIAVALAFQFPLSHLWHASTYRISPHVAAAEAAMARVPDGATVLTTLDLLAPLAARTDTFWIGNAAIRGPSTSSSTARTAATPRPRPTSPPSSPASTRRTPTPRSSPPATCTSSAAPADRRVERRAPLLAAGKMC